MIRSETVFWVSWASVSGAVSSTLHPASVPAMLDDVDTRLTDQYRGLAIATSQESATVDAFRKNLMVPDYRYASDPHSRHPAVSPPLSDDFIGCRLISVQKPQQSSADCDYNILLNTMLDRFDGYEYTMATPPSYQATPKEHGLLVALRGQQPPECLYRPRAATRRLMGLMRNSFDPVG